MELFLGKHKLKKYLVLIAPHVREFESICGKHKSIFFVSA